MQGGVKVGQTWIAGWHRKRAMLSARAHHCGRNIWRAVGGHWQPPSTSCPIEWQTNASGCPPHLCAVLVHLHIYMLVLNHLSSAVSNGCRQLPAPPWRRTHLCAGPQSPVQHGGKRMQAAARPTLASYTSMCWSSITCPVQCQTDAGSCPPHLGVVHIYVLVVRPSGQEAATGGVLEDADAV